jgi:hypothetical protein
LCPYGCRELVESLPSHFARHLAVRHNIGRFWPCPLLGAHVEGGHGKEAGPCAFEPDSRKANIKRHLLTRHRKDDATVASLMQALAPIERRPAERERAE